MVQNGRQQRLEILHKAFINAGRRGLRFSRIQKIYRDHDYNDAKATITDDRKLLNDILIEKNELDGPAIKEEILPGPGKPKIYFYNRLDYRLFESEDGLTVDQRKQVEKFIGELQSIHEIPVLQDVIVNLKNLLLATADTPETDEKPRKIFEPENNQYYKGTSHLLPLFEAIHKRQELRITYKPFDVPEATEQDYQPLYLKQFNRRWFLLVRPLEEAYKTVHLSLDRIQKIEPQDRTFQSAVAFDAEAHFENVIGVTVFKDRPIEKIHFRAQKPRAYYILTKPLHNSQKHLKEGADPKDAFMDFTIEVIPNNELYATLLEFGPDLEVLAPQTIRQEMARLAEELYKVYKKE
jgi:predicted DNA-binding transcriptional regulator YafY